MAKKKVTKKKLAKQEAPQHPMFHEMGKVLTQLRKDKKLTQSQVAKQLKVHSQFVSNWERGLCAPPEHVFGAMKNLYGIKGLVAKKVARAIVRDTINKVDVAYTALVG